MKRTPCKSSTFRPTQQKEVEVQDVCESPISVQGIGSKGRGTAGVGEVSMDARMTEGGPEAVMAGGADAGGHEGGSGICGVRRPSRVPRRPTPDVGRTGPPSRQEYTRRAVDTAN